MIPILYDKDETEFKTNGLGRLSDAISCIVTEERNGIYELEMV
jgi:phage-related protein